MNKQRIKRHKKIRARIKGTAKVPRLCVFRSNKHIYAQLIDDGKGKILIAVSDEQLKEKNKKQETRNKLDIAKEVGRLFASKAIEKKYKKVIFDRGGYKYHGRVKSLAEGAREGGLKF